jgi:predicted transcriptional regulator
MVIPLTPEALILREKKNKRKTMMNDYIKMLQQANIKIAELEKEHERVKKYNSSLLSKLKYYISEEEAEIRDLDQQSKGIEFAIDAGIDFQQIENDVAVCNAIRTRAKAKALKEQGK